MNNGKKNKGKKGLKTIRRSFVSLLDGSFLVNDWTRRHIRFIFFLVFLSLVYITNIISAEKKHRNIRAQEKQIKELEAVLATQNSELNNMSKPTAIYERLKDKGFVRNTDAYIIIEK